MLRIEKKMVEEFRLGVMERGAG